MNIKELLNWKSLLIIVAYSVIVVLNREGIIDLPSWLIWVLLIVFIGVLSLIGKKDKASEDENKQDNP